MKRVPVGDSFRSLPEPPRVQPGGVRLLADPVRFQALSSTESA